MIKKIDGNLREYMYKEINGNLREDEKKQMVI